jgi:enoyl-CoA hydratase/carnithine racemase
MERAGGMQNNIAGEANMPEHILISEIKDHTSTLTLNRPEKKNALSITLRDEITEALGELSSNPDVKVVVITGAGNVFSAGFDLEEFNVAATDPEFDKELWASSDRFHHACLFFPLPLIAAVNGPAIAGGFDLATMCDIRIACSEAYFSHPEISFGPVLYSPLYELVGGALARELCLTGRKVGADEALSLRLVSSVVPRNELEAEVERFTPLIAQASRENLMRTKSKIIERARLTKRATLDL